MSTIDDLTYRNRLLRLFKGTVLLLIFAFYVVLLAVQFMIGSWVSALVALGFILSVTLFRYIGYAVNRIGVRMRQSGEATKTTLRVQKILTTGLISAVLLHNVCLVAIVLFTSDFLDAGWVAGWVACWLLVIEGLFECVRRVSIKVDFEPALYGFPEDTPLGRDSHAARATGESQSTVARKIAALKDLLDRGEISEKAFRKTKDKLLVQRVLDDTD